MGDEVHVIARRQGPEAVAVECRHSHRIGGRDRIGDANEDNDQNPLPSTYLTGKHGARAAYESLLRSGYNIERWERPLTELAASAGPNTVVILAQPFSRETEDYKAVDQIVSRGGRVLATGL